MDSVIGNSLTAAWPVVHWLSVIYIVITFAQVTANLMTMSAFLGRAVRLFFVVFLLHSAGIYQQYVRTLAFVDVPNEIATVVSGSPVGVSAAAQFDKVSQAADFLVADAEAKNAGHSIFSVSAIGNEIGIRLADGFINLMVAFMFGVWLLGRMLLAVVLCYGPWLLLFELFERTRGFTEAWIGKIVGLLVFQFASAVLLQILIQCISHVLMDIHAAPGASVDDIVNNLMHLAGFMMTGLITLIALPSICAIGSGAAAGHAVATGFGVSMAARSMGAAGASGRAVGAAAGQSIRRAGVAAAGTIRNALRSATP